MPGGRLTANDRRRIAEGLAEHLGYAEIARRIGRPTSTVSREVNRNGGPGRYRPERAQRATDSRARRPRKHEIHRPALSSAPKPTPVDDGIAAYTGELTDVLVRTGVPRTGAAIVARLILSETGSSSAAELAAALRVSPATISTAVATLEAHELIRRSHEPGTRRDRYTLDTAVWYRTTMAGVRANHTLTETARRGAELLPSGTAAGARIRAMAAYLEHIGADMERSARRWRHLLDAASS
ncbi:helix-turn-helix domain-containing protein [Nocardia veterana]|uniref:Helix-turn-helix domain-containing protein n=1 Tax=Nocardia veterana TaxID=132249 RepID=A0A7X6RJ01_9NOCA|nr:helix-turn-helix domain-containing protein [Nocardia veterana]NKY87681.1 helix-turn-helix domain-containing protein [Nocardia veterana]